MFHKITKFNEAVPLVEHIDNTSDDWHVGVTSIDFWHGLRRLVTLGEFWVFNTTTNKTIDHSTLKPGFYNFTDIKRFFNVKVRKLFMLDDVIRLQLNPNTWISINDPLAKFMGFRFRASEYNHRG